MFNILCLTYVQGWNQLVGNQNQNTKDLHIYIASQQGSYTLSGQFNSAVQQGTEEYKATLRDIDDIAVYLKSLKAEGISVLWRPLHEPGGKWFWWEAHGSQVTKYLYDITFNRYMNYHKLDNLIWVWSIPEQEVSKENQD